MPSESSSSRKKVKAEILRRLEAGEGGAAIAQAVGVTRQYVSALKKQLEQSSAEEMLARSKRGRPKNVPFTPSEDEWLREYLRKGQRPDGTAAPNLTESRVKTLFKQAHGRTLTVHQLRKFCTDEGWRLARPESEYAAGEFLDELPEVSSKPIAPPASTSESPLKRKRGRPRKELSADDSSTHSDEMIEAMARSNAEIVERLKKQRAEAAPQPVRRVAPKLGRNDPCPFDSKKKFKRCCGRQGLTYCERQADSEAPVG
jgi:hypothetical protein